MKLKLVHILNNLDGEKEKLSINNLQSLQKIGVEYIQQLTPLYDGEEYKKPSAIKIYDNVDYIYNKCHYGAYESHKKAIKENFSDDIDALIVCECDCMLNISLDDFLNEMKKTLNFCEKYDLYQFSWGGKISNNIIQGNVIKLDEEYPNYCVVPKIIGIHFIVYPKKSREFFLKKIDDIPWDTPDVWLNLVINLDFNYIGKQGNVFDVLAYQVDGVSIVDNTFKSMMDFINLNYKFKFSIDRDINRIYIFCDSNIETKVFIYEWFPNNRNVYNDILIYSTSTTFNNNQFWYAPIKSIKDLNIRVLVTKLDGNIIREKYFFCEN